LASALALHGWPVERAKAPQVCFFFTSNPSHLNLIQHFILEVGEALSSLSGLKSGAKPWLVMRVSRYASHKQN
jgi:hypothetical protein